MSWSETELFPGPDGNTNQGHKADDLVWSRTLSHLFCIQILATTSTECMGHLRFLQLSDISFFISKIEIIAHPVWFSG